MPSQLASLPPQDFVLELFDRARQRSAFGHVGWGIAIGAHVLAAGLALDETRPVAGPLLPPVEVELAPPPQAPPRSTPPKEEEPVPERPQVAKLAAAAPPQPAQVGALLTAKADPLPTPAAEEPVDFTNDPAAAGFGSGVVAIGGKAKVGSANAQSSTALAGPGSAPVGPAAGDGLTPVSDLSRKPGLGESDPCRGYFPSGASDDVASAAVMVTVGRNGSVSSVKLLSESPPRQGFGAAARTCMTSKRFSPGLDRNGKPTATAIRVNIRFTR